MIPTLFVRAAARRSLVNNSVRSFASKPPTSPNAPQSKKDAPSPAPQGDEAAAEKPEAPSEQVQAEGPSVTALPSLDFAPGEEPHRERTGAKSSKDSLSSIERKRRFWGRVSAGIMVFGLAAGAWHAGREWEEEELREMRMVRDLQADLVPDCSCTYATEARRRAGHSMGSDASTLQRVVRRKSSLNERLCWSGAITYRVLVDLYRASLERAPAATSSTSASEAIHPACLGGRPPCDVDMGCALRSSRTHIILLIIHQRQHGWRTAKRPGVDYFLAYLSQFYEIVIFTTQYHYVGSCSVGFWLPY